MIFKLFQPMWGIFRFLSLGSIILTSPCIQLKPSWYPCSCPQVAIICMPTQMPINGLPVFMWASIASYKPKIEFNSCLQSANAPTPGKTTLSALTTSSGLLETLTCPTLSSSDISWKLFSADLKFPEL